MRNIGVWTICHPIPYNHHNTRPYSLRLLLCVRGMSTRVSVSIFVEASILHTVHKAAPQQNITSSSSADLPNTECAWMDSESYTLNPHPKVHISTDPEPRALSSQTSAPNSLTYLQPSWLPTLNLPVASHSRESFGVQLLDLMLGLDDPLNDYVLRMKSQEHGSNF